MTTLGNMLTTLRYKLLLLALLIGTTALAQNILDVSLDSADILIGEQVSLKLKLTADADAHIQFPQYSEESPLSPGIETLELSRPDTTLLDNGRRIELHARYLITSFDSAVYSLQPYVLVDDDTVRARNNVGLRVNSIEVDTVHTDQFNGPAAPVNVPFEWQPSLWLQSLSLWLLFALVIMMCVRLSDKKPKVRKVVVPVPIPPHRKALQAVSEINDSDLREAFEQLSEKMRIYLNERFGVQTLERVSEDILAAMRPNLDARQNRLLTDVLTTADLVKFADYSSTTAEWQQIRQAATDFITSTLDHEAENRKPEVRYVKVGEVELARKRKILLIATCIVSAIFIGWAIYLGHEIYQTFF